MSESLSQAEIDALRAAVKSGAAMEEEAAPPAPTAEQVKVVAYDFRKPHLIASDQHHALQMLHESLGKQFQAALLSAVKTGAEVKLVAMDQISYGEFMLSLSNPTCLAALATKPNIGQVAFQIDIPIAMAICDILLGGNGQITPETRELTTLESTIFSSITGLLLKEISGSWASMAEVAFSVAAQESNPQFMQITTPETACLNMMYDVRIAEITGVLNICYPFEVIQAILAAAEKRSGKRTGAGADGDAMLHALQEVPLVLRVVIGGGPVTAEELSHLQPGDLLCLNRRIDTPLEVCLGDNPIFQAVPGTHKGKIAVLLK
jgi:flagellar motor switch protein FliM